MGGFEIYGGKLSQQVLMMALSGESEGGFEMTPGWFVRSRASRGTATPFAAMESRSHFAIGEPRAAFGI